MKKILSNRIKGTLLVSVIMALPFVINAQSTNTIQPQASPARANVWYFGDYAGLDFSGGAPVAITNGAMESFECAGTMCDVNGNLLFYTNGGDFPYAGGVWNRNNQLMPNGITTGWGGCNSSEQGAMIVPLPRSQNLYYLFTTDCMENNGVGGLRYNIIDMNADGGLGDVVVSAQKLTAPTDESLAVIQHANGVDWWIVTHKLQTDSFYVYQFNNHGIVGLVKTKIGNVTPYWAGALKASTDGTKLVYAGLNWTSLFDFNNKTGAITNYVDLNLAGYTDAFSDNCRYLYVATGSGKEIYQYDLASTDIPGTKTLIGTTASTGFGGIAIGPDNKIYCSRFVSSPYVGVINNPDLKGTACNYVDSGVYLGGKLVQGGMPNFPNTMLGGCVDNSLSDNDGAYSNYDTSVDISLTVEYHDSHRATLSWEDTKYSDKYMVMYRETNGAWSKIVVSGFTANLDSLRPNTSYEVRVVPVLSDNPDYEPMTDHFLVDVLAAAKTGSTPGAQETEGTAYLTTDQNLDFDLYPNPSHGGSTNVTVNVGDESSDLTIKIMDMQGKVINEQKMSDISGYAHYQLATDQLENGIYNIQIETASNISTKKLVVVR